MWIAGGLSLAVDVCSAYMCGVPHTYIWHYKLHCREGVREGGREGEREEGREKGRVSVHKHVRIQFVHPLVCMSACFMYT